MVDEIFASASPAAKFDEMNRRYLIINNLFIICLAFKHCKDIIVKFL